MRASGKTEEQIEQWFPKSMQEKRKEQIESYRSLKEEVEALKQRLADLEEHVYMPPKQNLEEASKSGKKVP